VNIAVDPHGPGLCAIPSNPVPEGARVGYFKTRDNVRLRYALFPRTGPEHKGTVCLVQGRTEFIEKYFETITDFQSRGFAVATFDLRGQGGSDRLIGNKKLGYVEKFDDYWTDLSSFHAEILLPDSPPPYFLVGHSTGGLVSLLAATRDRLMFDRVFLSAPMVSLPGLPFGIKGTKRVMDFACFLGLSQLPMQRKTDRVPDEDGFAGNPLTSDKTRYMRSVDVLKARPDLEVDAPTVAWIAAALEGMAQANDDLFPQALKVPVFMLAAARDTVVSPGAIENLGLRMRTGHHTLIAGAKHELFMETDIVRAQVFAAFDAFVTNQTG
jgi:lysophospholipase